MKVIDHAGNSLKAGRLLRWQPSQLPDLYVKVKDIVPPTKDMPGKVEFTVTFGIAPQKGEQGAVQFKDFITVFDPEDELKAEAVVEKVAEGNVRTMTAR